LIFSFSRHVQRLSSSRKAWQLQVAARDLGHIEAGLMRRTHPARRRELLHLAALLPARDAEARCWRRCVANRFLLSITPAITCRAAATQASAFGAFRPPPRRLLRACANLGCGFGEVVRGTRLRQRCCCDYYCSPACFLADQGRHESTCVAHLDPPGGLER
jgi:hypothetical protein